MKQNGHGMKPDFKIIAVDMNRYQTFESFHPL